MRLPWNYILVSLAIGLLLGGAGGLYCSRHVEGRWTRKSSEMFLRRLDHELHLTDAQRRQIRSLLDANREKMAAYKDEIRKATRTEIHSLLTPDQQPRFDALTAHHDAQRKKGIGQ